MWRYLVDAPCLPSDSEYIAFIGESASNVEARMKRWAQVRVTVIRQLAAKLESSESLSAAHVCSFLTAAGNW